MYVSKYDKSCNVARKRNTVQVVQVAKRQRCSGESTNMVGQKQPTSVQRVSSDVKGRLKYEKPERNRENVKSREKREQ